MTRGPFRRLPKNLCDFALRCHDPSLTRSSVELRPPSRQRPKRAWIVETAQVRPGYLEGKPIYPAPGPIHWRAGATGAVAMVAKWLVTSDATRMGKKGVNAFASRFTPHCHTPHCHTPHTPKLSPLTTHRMAHAAVCRLGLGLQPMLRPRPRSRCRYALCLL